MAVAKPKSGIEILARDVEMVDTDSLLPHPSNPNQGDVGEICLSIQKNGFYRPLVVQRSTRYILTGNHTWQAARQLGIGQVPVTWIDCSDEVALRILLVDNRSAQLAVYDDNKLAELLQGIMQDVGTLEGTGFDGNALDQLLADLEGGGPVTGEDSIPDPPLNPITITGDLWLLGSHRLLCGDSNEENSSTRVLNGAIPGCTIYDPEWDDVPKIKIPMGAMLVFTDGNRCGDAITQFGSPTWVFVWDCGACWYTPNRPLKRMKMALWYGDVKSYNSDGSHYRGKGSVAHEVTNTRGTYQYVPDPRGLHLADLFCSQLARAHSDGEHKHSKPLDWIRCLIGNCSKGAVYDPFGGSGSALIACDQLGRSCYMVEIDPGWCDAIVLRWQEFTGEEATLAGDGRTFGEIKLGRYPVEIPPDPASRNTSSQEIATIPPPAARNRPNQSRQRAASN